MSTIPEIQTSSNIPPPSPSRFDLDDQDCWPIAKHRAFLDSLRSQHKPNPEITRKSKERRDKCARWLRKLFSRADRGWIVIWCHAPEDSTLAHESKCFNLADSDWYKQAAAYAIGASRHFDTYIGCYILGAPVPSPQRGKAKDVIGLAFFHNDLDVAHAEHASENLPPTKDDAIGLLEKGPLPPHLVNTSGHGLHAYWLLDEVLWIDNDEDRQRAKELFGRFQKQIIKAAKKREWHVDWTALLNAVLRPVATRNRKNPDHIKTVQEIDYRNAAKRRYTIAEIEEALPRKSKRRVWKPFTPHKEALSLKEAPTDLRWERTASVKDVVKACGFAKYALENWSDLGDDPAFALLSNLAYCTDSDSVVGRLQPQADRQPGSSGGVSPHADPLKKLIQIRDVGYRPQNCYKIARLNEAAEICAQCPFHRKGKSPLHVALRPRPEDIDYSEMLEPFGFDERTKQRIEHLLRHGVRNRPAVPDENGVITWLGRIHKGQPVFKDRNDDVVSVRRELARLALRRTLRRDEEVSVWHLDPRCVDLRLFHIRKGRRRALSSHTDFIVRHYLTYGSSQEIADELFDKHGLDVTARAVTKWISGWKTLEEVHAITQRTVQ